ncbi:Cti6p NDAI_0I01300 [Naumovozyma dairenensis CBS 421]|uniref:Zinc finger PHD-type domain-containing protein n=1 Tax=Naumovozyma dairenensis (strain ATCC 10597 / BCRC 20456 / CBS 421 / NBRC 0211 / NRRL Y-12639) TaxID=1071378 RepID=G0WFY8_NAUDC|nr:hypothetical protein NDAI_0I01300 [Naumovozyma dairenensis CBS 421]CCD26699.1 hypothetical protein NDAI_0I01300 [Naumovozyma dairenensis CBS 421]
MSVVTKEFQTQPGNEDPKQLAVAAAVAEEEVKEEEEDIADVDVEAEEEEEEITRCICGKIDLPDGDSGLYIQCEQCSVWQHGYCVGILENDNVPDKYWCELCKPELHQIAPSGKSSIYKGSKEIEPKEQEEVQEDTRKIDDDAYDNLVAEGENDDEHNKKLQRNNNDHVDALHTDDQKEDVDDDMIPDKPDHEPTPETTKQIRDNRKRATTMEREEKQYQLMLQKAIDASKLVGNPEDDNATKESKNEHDEMKDEEEKLNGEEKDNIKNNETTNFKNDSNSSSFTNSTKKSISPPASLTSEETDVKEEIMKKPAPRRSTRVTKPRINKSRSNTSVNSNTSTTKRNAARKLKDNNSNNTYNDNDIALSKSVKPRIPPKRTTMNEMRRRSAAILEYISRTQWELSGEQASRDQIARFVDNDKFIKEKIDSIYDKHNDLLKSMDELAKQVIHWEEKYC